MTQIHRGQGDPDGVGACFPPIAERQIVRFVELLGERPGLASALVAVLQQPIGPLRPIGERDATFARGDRLGSLQREHCDVTECADGRAAELCPVGVRGVFDDMDVVAAGQLEGLDWSLQTFVQAPNRLFQPTTKKPAKSIIITAILRLNRVFLRLRFCASRKNRCKYWPV